MNHARFVSMQDAQLFAGQFARIYVRGNHREACYLVLSLLPPLDSVTRLLGDIALLFAAVPCPGDICLEAVGRSSLLL